MASTLISAAVALLAFANGVVILGKATRENHGAIYKISGWFVILVSIFIMACSAMQSAVGMYRWRYSDEAMGPYGYMRWMRSFHHGYDNDRWDRDDDRNDDDRNYDYRNNSYRDYNNNGYNRSRRGNETYNDSTGRGTR